jgi:hypothetical protein
MIKKTLWRLCFTAAKGTMLAMCNYQTLYHSTCGYVIRCLSCRRMQVAFGTTAISFSVQEFYSFVEMLRHSEEQALCAGLDYEKVMSLPLPDENVMLVLTAAETCRLSEMLQESRALLEAYQILEATVPPDSGDIL